MTPPRSARSPSWRRALALLPAAAALAGCVTLFPKTPPAQLYRFEAQVPPAQAAAAGPEVLVQESSLDFDQAAGGDRLLTTTGDEVAYVAGARWASPASELFDAAVAHGFDAAGGRVRLVPPGPAHVAYRLKLAVTRFEAEYANGAGAPPTIQVRLHAVLERQDDLSIVGEKDFDEPASATENRVGAMVAAYDQATSKTVADLVSWVAATVR
jgi:cholesterol transport system auxiliary component